MSLLLRNPASVSSATASTPAFDTTDLVAWYDFNDTVPGEGKEDSHGTYGMTEENSVTFSTAGPEYVQGRASGNAHLAQVSSGIGTDWGNPDQDKSVVVRFKRVATGSTDQAFAVGAKIRIEASDSTIGWRLCHSSSVTVSHTSGTDWTWVYLERVSSSNVKTVSVNDGEATTTDSSFASYDVGTTFVGGSGAFGVDDIDIDYLAFFNRILTTEEQTFLYNSGGTLGYSGGTIIQA